MHSLRSLIQNNRLSATAFLLLALLMKLVVPAGFMPVADNGRMIISICSGAGPMVLSVPGQSKTDDSGHPGKSEQPCAFTGLSASSLAAADPVVLAAAILFILALGLRPVLVLMPLAPAYLWPPTTGPPARD